MCASPSSVPTRELMSMLFKIAVKKISPNEILVKEEIEVKKKKILSRACHPVGVCEDDVRCVTNYTSCKKYSHVRRSAWFFVQSDWVYGWRKQR